VKLPDELAQTIPKMRPVEQPEAAPATWLLSDGSGNYLIYGPAADITIANNSTPESGTYRARWIDPKSGEIVTDERLDLHSGQVEMKTNILWLTPTVD
jgi:hypothetical protein